MMSLSYGKVSQHPARLLLATETDDPGNIMFIMVYVMQPALTIHVHVCRFPCISMVNYYSSVSSSAYMYRHYTGCIRPWYTCHVLTKVKHLDLSRQS